jgi:hypothetical protein
VILADPTLYPTLLAAADAAGATSVRARVSWLRANLGTQAPPAISIQPGCRVALLRCNPPPCVELWAVADADLASDWETA